jgi:hypothetical protein
VEFTERHERSFYLNSGGSIDYNGITKMKTKAEIVQRLLEEKKIDAEEAVILLMNDGQAVVTVYPIYPVQPAPVWSSNPWTLPIVTYSESTI